MSARVPVAKAEWPAEWFGLSTWMFVDNPLNVRHEDGHRMHILGGVLMNGTNLVALVWAGGQNIARLDAENDWMLEERIDPHAPKAARQMWRQVIRAFAGSRKEVDGMTEAEQRKLADETFRSPTITWLGGRLA